MTFNKKYNQKRTNQSGSGRFERKGPRKSSGYNAEISGRSEKKRFSYRDDIKNRPFKRYTTKREEEPGNDKAFDKRDKPFERKEAAKRHDNFSKRRERTYSGYGNYRDKKSGNEGANNERKESFSREGITKKYDRFSRNNQRPYSKNRGEDFKQNRFKYRNDGTAFKEGSENRYSRFTERNKTGRKVFVSKKQGISTQTKPKPDDGKIRLNRYISTSGICSRREADDLIVAGLITVNGKIVNELGSKVFENDEVRYNGELIKKERNVYILLNKPKDYVTTVKDPYAKHTVLDLIKGACKERVFPVGRLDRNTTGVLLLTNDGDLTKKLTHPGFNRKKIYHVFLDKNLKAPDLNTISTGLELEDGFIKVDDISFVIADDKKQVGIEIHSGRNRIVRRIFEHLGYRVVRLDRVYFAGLTKKGLQKGQWRFLTDREISMLMMGSFK